jgi:hypothetical protein
MFLTYVDFVGKYELHTGMYDQNKLQDYIDRYEKRYLIELLGADLYAEFMSDIDSVTKIPLSPTFIQIFDPFEVNVYFNRLLISEGIKEMLKGFIYFEYAKDLMNQMTPFGNVKQKSENSTLVSTLNSMMYARYNEAVKTYKAIQEFILLNQTNTTNGQVISADFEFTLSLGTGGSGYSTATDVQTNLSGVPETLNLNAIGSGYSTASGVTTTGVFGSGLTLDIVDDGAGGIDSFTIVDAGSGYYVNEILSIDAGNFDAFLQVTSITEPSSDGTGLTLDIVANEIGGVDGFFLSASGTGYVDGSFTTTGSVSGTGLIVNITTDALTGSVLTCEVETGSSGQNYVGGEVLTIDSGNLDATITLTSVTDGSVTEFTINQSGSNYEVNDLFIINGGNNDCLMKITYVGIGDFTKFKGVQKLFNYWI